MFPPASFNRDRNGKLRPNILFSKPKAKERHGSRHRTLVFKGCDDHCKWEGRPWAFGIAGGFVLCWLLTGPIFHFSDTWQLVMNTISSIVTFLMVFLIQNAQNRESSALQLKLDELIRVTEARNKLMGIERLSEPELDSVRDELEQRAKRNDRAYATDPTGDSATSRTQRTTDSSKADG